MNEEERQAAIERCRQREETLKQAVEIADAIPPNRRALIEKAFKQADEDARNYSTNYDRWLRMMDISWGV